MSWWSYKPYVSVAQRRASAALEAFRLTRTGRKLSPVKIEGRTISRTFWGTAWCENLESYSDFSNRLPRGRTYLRNGSVIDVQITPGRVNALVMGSSLYEISIDIKPLKVGAWKAIKRECAGQIGSLLELLQGRLSRGVMQIMTRPAHGLFPKPSEIQLDCSCPDWADMCKHVAAVLYGVGARLDEKPELLFVLRKVDHLELIAQAGIIQPRTNTRAKHKTIKSGDLADVFGIELDAGVQALAVPSRHAARSKPSGPAGKPIVTIITKRAASKTSSKTARVVRDAIPSTATAKTTKGRDARRTVRKI